MRDFIKVIGNIDFRKIEHKHGEQFIQTCLDGGNRPATVGKKVGTMKRLFQLSVQRGQLEENPFRFLRKPKYSRQSICVFTDEECIRMMNVARQKQIGFPFRWDILFLTALCTGMRRGELLNTTWKDIDFAGEKINVSPKSENDYTWQWKIKDTDRRSVLLTAADFGALNGLNLYKPSGLTYPKFTDKTQIKDYLKNTTAVDMRWMLSAQLIATELDVLHGFLNTSTLVYVGPSTYVPSGFITIGDIINNANTALTLSGPENRAKQEYWKNLLDGLNNNKLPFVCSCLKL